LLSRRFSLLPVVLWRTTPARSFVAFARNFLNSWRQPETALVNQILDEKVVFFRAHKRLPDGPGKPDWITKKSSSTRCICYPGVNKAIDQQIWTPALKMDLTVRQLQRAGGNFFQPLIIIKAALGYSVPCTQIKEQISKKCYFWMFGLLRSFSLWNCDRNTLQ
jgi:hypothetical protein